MVGWLSAAWAAPSPRLPCDQIAEKLVSETLPERPTAPTFWWVSENPCGSGRLGGPVPPAALEVWCVDLLGRRSGPSTTLSRELVVTRETRYVGGDEVGPRVEWNPYSRRAMSWTEYAADLANGLMVEWTDEGALVSWMKKGIKEGPSYKLGLRGTVELVTFWVDGARSTRTCVWRDEKLAIDSQ